MLAQLTDSDIYGSAFTLFLLGVAVWFIRRLVRSLRGTTVKSIVLAHLGEKHVERIAINVREFPYRMRVDIQRAVDRMFHEELRITKFYGLQAGVRDSIKLRDTLASDFNSSLVAPPEFEDVDIGEDAPVRCLTVGMWLLEQGPVKLVALLAAVAEYGAPSAVSIQVASVTGASSVDLVQRIFTQLEKDAAEAKSYRGKVLSLEVSGAYYSGQRAGMKVHRLRAVEREQVILPASTLELLERNVLNFVRQRPGLTRCGQSTKKGLLFYGPPGTGKTHTIHYLAKALPGHTTLLISAEQVVYLDEYMTLARLLQPSLVVLEDVDLIARDRQVMQSGCEESLLNKLLNEMDGLRPEADVIFVLTTNRPLALERALASRPGRIDQAIEFPLPDDAGRRKLVRLYSRSIEVPDEVVEGTVLRTEKVSAAFIKELMRRSVQFHLERTNNGQSGLPSRLEMTDVENALGELLFQGGSLNRALLGAGQIEDGATATADRAAFVSKS